MPNWVKNKVTVKGDSEQKKTLFEMFSKRVDFEKIVPMPEELKNTISPVRYERLTHEERIKCNELKRKYGADNWYDWAWKNWGTKWNACDSIIDKSESTMEFDTAWATPGKIFILLSKQFDKLVFTVEYADEDLGYNCGVAEYQNGKKVLKKPKLKEGSEKAEKFAMDLWKWKEEEDA